MKKIKLIAIIVTTVLFLAFFAFCVFNFIQKTEWASFFSAVLGILASAAFGVWVSYIFQKMNDKIQQDKDNALIEMIREREFVDLRIKLSMLIRQFNLREDQLLNKIKADNLKKSFSKYDIDLENLTTNYFVFMKIYDNIETYFPNIKDRNFVKTNIDCLLFRDELRKKYSKSKNTCCCEIETSIDFRVSETYDTFSTFNICCMELFKKMQQLNLDYKLKIFTDEEIDAIGAFSYEIGPGYFINFYPPYEILALFPKFLRIQKFLKADFIPAYQKESFWQGIINANKIQDEQESTIKEWLRKNGDMANEILLTWQKDKN